MVKIENHLGTREVSREFFTSLVSATVSGCFGVAGMADPNPPKGLKRLITRPDDSRGVVIRVQGDSLVIDLHIEVTYGTNISAIVKSITHKVCYTVEDVTGIHVAAVNVYVDGLKNS